MNVSGADPVQKISIIPRGVATLGYTTEDRFLMIKSELGIRMPVLIGGRGDVGGFDQIIPRDR